jgi:hypothetical protein
MPLRGNPNPGNALDALDGSVMDTDEGGLRNVFEIRVNWCPLVVF